MRDYFKSQLPLMPNPIGHPHAKELEAMDQFLTENPIIAIHATHDLVEAGTSTSRGSPGMSGDQVVRCFIVKHLNSFSYRELAFHLQDSISYRRFCQIGIADKPLSRSALQSNIRRLSETTLNMMNDCLVNIAVDEGIESGKAARMDATAVDTDIHHPADSAQLWDVNRVLVRMMRQARDLDEGIRFTNHNKRAHRRHLNVINAGKKPTVRKRAYRDLFKVTDKTLCYARHVVQRLRQFSQESPWPDCEVAFALAKEMERIMELGGKVLDQARRRILNNEKVPAREKIFSIFEEHTDIIIKDNRETHFGHKIFLTAGSSSLVIDCAMPRWNPADSTWAEALTTRAIEVLGTTPKSVSMDGGFASKRNLKSIKKMGVENVCFHKRRGIEVEDMVSSTWIYKKLRCFRAGIEGIISFLKRCIGLDRCRDHGFSGFKRYVWRSIISCNLLIMARHRLRET